MSVDRAANQLWEHPIGRLLLLLVGAGLVAGALTTYPQVLPAIRWALPVCLILWGASLLYRHGASGHLTVAAGCLLILGGFTYASHLLLSMGELLGAVAQLVVVVGIFTELFAAHYRDQDRLSY